MVLIEDITFTRNNLNIFKNYISNIKTLNIEKIQFLEYHSMAFPKYDELKMEKDIFKRIKKSDVDKIICDFKQALNADVLIEYLTI